MIHLITRWFLIALSLLVAAWLVPGVEITSLYIALITAAFLGLVNVIIRPILIILTLPITVITLGLFVLVINGLLFWFIASFIDGFEVSGFAAAFMGALVVSIVSFLGNRLIKNSASESDGTEMV